jgi:gamma-glutamyltranspeptidase/glutathione hydrolase
MNRPPVPLLVALLLLSFLPAVQAFDVGSHGAVATVSPIASQAAREAMARGGNAVDAAVVAALTLGVVDGHNSGIGGGCFLVIRLASGKVIQVDGRETAPALATEDMFLREGRPDPAASQTGALAVGIPGSLAAYDWALRRYGRLPLKQHLQEAARFAADGFQLPPSFAARLRGEVGDVARDPGARAIFLHPGGSPLQPGELLVQPDLAATYRTLGEQGTRWFYNGAFASRVGDWMREHGGRVRASDFASYRLKIREPIRTRYHGCEVVGFPPPSSGGVHVAEILQILEHFDLRSMGRGSAEFVHVVTEAMKLAFADRAYWLGDPDFTRVPRGLVSSRYAATLALKVDRTRAAVVEGHGTPDDAGSNWFGKHTTHFCTADAEGNWVACTATINTTLGAKVVVPGTGVVLNNQMDDFSASPGAANAFGLVGGGANAVAPGKRPLSSMSPTLVLRNGRPILSVGAAGGPTIISQTVLAIVGAVDFGMTPREALAAVRFHHQWRPDVLHVEASLDAAVVQELRRRGHTVVVDPAIGACQMIALGPGGFEAAADPRLEGLGLQW